MRNRAPAYTRRDRQQRGDTSRRAGGNLKIRDKLGNVVVAQGILVDRLSELDDDEVAISTVPLAAEEGSGESSTAAAVAMRNNSGGDLEKGAVVVVDETADQAVTTTTTQGDTRIAGVTLEPIANGAVGRVLFNGFAADVITTGEVLRGEYAQTSAVASAAQGTASREAGSFAVILTDAESAISSFATDAAVTEEDGSVTSLPVTMPTSVIDGTAVGRVLFLALWRDPAVTSDPTVTGWTRIGATSGFWFYYRISEAGDTLTATWTTASPAVAVILVLDDRVSLADPVEDQAFDATSAAAAIAGLSPAPRYAIAAVQADVATPADWTQLAEGAADGGGATVDLNATVGTVTHDTAAGRHTGDAARLWNDPAKANDGDNGTFAFVNGGTTDYTCYLKSDLGAAYRVSSFVLYMTSEHTEVDQIQYSTDGVNWTTIAFTETGSRTGANPPATGATLTFDGGPIVARYWAVRANHGAGSGSGGPTLARWEIRGQPLIPVRGNLVGRYIARDASVASPYAGAGQEADAVVAYNLDEEPLASALLYGPDLGGMDDHLADASDAHDAAAVSFDPSGLTNIVATNVQDALEELDAVAGGGGGGSVATDSIWDEAGDTVVGTGANTAVRRKNNDGAAVAPTVNDDSGDGYSIGSMWHDTTADFSYVCLDASVGAAVWRMVGTAAWVAYTPAFTTSGAGADPTVGNGLLLGAYKRLDPKTIALHILFQFGSTSTAGSGVYLLGLPAGMSAATSQVCAAVLTDASAGGYFAASALISWVTTTDFVIAVADAVAPRSLSHNNPFVWATNDTLVIDGVIRIA